MFRIFDSKKVTDCLLSGFIPSRAADRIVKTNNTSFTYEYLDEDTGERYIITPYPSGHTTHGKRAASEVLVTLDGMSYEKRNFNASNKGVACFEYFINGKCVNEKVYKEHRLNRTTPFTVSNNRSEEVGNSLALGTYK